MISPQTLPKRAQLLSQLKRDREFLNQLIASLERYQHGKRVQEGRGCASLDHVLLTFPGLRKPKQSRRELDGVRQVSTLLPWKVGQAK